MKKVFFMMIFLASTILYCKSGFLNYAVVMAFHPVMSNYNINMDLFYRDIDAKNEKEYQRKFAQIQKEVSEELNKIKTKNDKIFKQIKKEMVRKNERERFRFKSIIQAKEDYENNIKGIKPYQFPKVELKENKKEKKEEIKVTIPNDNSKIEKIDDSVKAKYFKEYRKQIDNIEKTYKKQTAMIDKKIENLKLNISKNFEYAYRKLLLSKSESKKLIIKIKNDIKEAVAYVAKKKKLSVVFNSSNEFFNEFIPEQNKVFKPKTRFDRNKINTSIMNKYRNMINTFVHNSPISKKSIMNAKNMKKGNFQTQGGSDDEFQYLNYENWFNNLEIWFKNNVSNFNSVKLNNQLFIYGGDDITIDVIKEIFDRYKINPVLANDIVKYLSVKIEK